MKQVKTLARCRSDSGAGKRLVVQQLTISKNMLSCIKKRRKN